jgi:hypothetical protein
MLVIKSNETIQHFGILLEKYIDQRINYQIVENQALCQEYR